MIQFTFQLAAALAWIIILTIIFGAFLQIESPPWGTVENMIALGAFGIVCSYLSGIFAEHRW